MPDQRYGADNCAPFTVLIDDSRVFRDDRTCLVARTSAAAMQLLQELRWRRIDHLWLDHDLGRDDDIWPVMRMLEDAHLHGEPFDIGVVHVHASRSGPAHRMAISLRRAAYSTERSHDLGMWKRWDGRSTDRTTAAVQPKAADCCTRAPLLDADELWAVHTALSATVECITSSDADVQLIMDLQEEAQELVASLFSSIGTPAKATTRHEPQVQQARHVEGLHELHLDPPLDLADVLAPQPDVDQ
jgi:hypothetical protein